MEIKKVFTSGIIGFFIAASFYLWLTDLNTVEILYKFFIYLCIGSVLTIIIYLLLYRLTLPRLSNYSPSWKIVWLSGSILFGIWLAINIPIPAPHLLQTVSLTITSTGQKNPLSQGSEVWIFGLYYDDGRLVNTDNFSIGNDWVVKEGKLIAPTMDHPASLTWSGQINGDLNLSLLAHPWSGVVSIDWIGTKQTIDLYDPNGKYLKITLPVNTSSAIWTNILYFFSVGTGIGLLLFTISTLLVTRSYSSFKSGNLSNKWRWLYYALPMIIIGIIYLLAFWPGIMSPDSIDQWSQIVTGHFNDWHPAFHTFMIWLLTRIFYTPASIAIAQIVILGILTGKILEILESMGISKIVCWIACLIFALSPVNGVMIITLWKDIPYSIGILLVTYLILLIIQTKGIWIKKWQNILSLGIISTLIALFRHNGLPVAIITLCVFLIAYRKLWKQFTVSILIVILLFFMITVPLYNIINVVKVPTSLAMSVPLHYLGAFVNADVPLSSVEKVVLNSIMSNSTNWEYDCDYANPKIYHKNLNTSYISNNKLDIIKTLFVLIIKHPQVAIEHYTCVSSLIWRITDIDGYVYTNPVTWGSSVESNPYIVPSPKIPFLNAMLSTILHETTINKYVQSLFWRPAVYLYIVFIIIVIQSLRQKKPSFFLLFIPILAQSIILSVLIPVEDFRYQYSIYLVSLILWPIITL